MILDAKGQPIVARVKARADLAAAMQKPRREIRATFDAARSSVDMDNYWVNADALDADSAHSTQVRRTLVKRARYEAANNGYTDGMLQTHADFLVGTGPTLRMQSQSPAFNSLVEDKWRSWSRAVQLRRKLWCMAHARVQDGESFGIIRNNSRITDQVDLDVMLIETEMCHSPTIPPYREGYIDGIRFDEFGNPIYYDILPYHPGGSFSWMALEPIRIAAKYIVHWFTLRRPGQHRGVPEFRSTLNTGGAARRWREATLAAAEVAADYAAIITTNMTPDGADPVQPLTSVPIDKRLMTALPMGWDVKQMKAEQPTASYEAFHRNLVQEQARPLAIPANIAMCDSSGYNFASGKLDHGTYFLKLDREREDCQDTVLDPLFERFFERARLVYGFRGDGSVPSHTWDWPQYPVADVVSQAQARKINLSTGIASPSSVCAEDGVDWTDHITQLANDYGVTVEEMKAVVMRQNFMQSMQVQMQTEMAQRNAGVPAQEDATNGG
jgi:capsid protein